MGSFGQRPIPAVQHSPFLDESQASALTDIDTLIEQALRAKREAERQKAIYDSLRDQLCATLKAEGLQNLESANGKVRLKETKSGWTFSDEVSALAAELKTKQDIEKRMGVAKPGKITLSADVFPLS